MLAGNLWGEKSLTVGRDSKLRSRVTRGRGVWLAVALVALAAAGCGSSGKEDAGGSRASAAASDDAAAPVDMERLRRDLDDALEFTYERHMNTQDHAAWQIVHGILAYGRKLQIEADGQVVSALDHALGGGFMRGWNMRPGDKGLESVLESGSKEGQGHEDQWLGYLSQVGLQKSAQLKVRGQEYTVEDLIRQAQWDVYDGMEATWTLMAFTTYLPLDTQWQARDGSQWTIERLVGMEAGQPLGESACGGAHRMYGLTCAVNRFAREKRPLAGAWKAADDRIQTCIAAARAFQQPDGSLSTDWFERPAASPEIALRISTTGHVLEFLVLAMTNEQVREPWVARAADRLCDMLRQTRELPVECGALYHAAHGLYLYRLRMFGSAWKPAGEGGATGEAAPDVPVTSEANAAKEESVGATGSSADGSEPAAGATVENASAS